MTIALCILGATVPPNLRAQDTASEGIRGAALVPVITGPEDATGLSGSTATMQSPKQTWSPDTATVVYTSRVTGNGEIFWRPGREGTPVNLTRHEGEDHWGRVSPEGAWLVFQSRRTGDHEVLLQPLTASAEVRNLTSDPGAEDLLPEWSPDGTRILFFSTRGEERGPQGQLRGNLYTMNLDGREVTRLTRSPLSSSFGGHWSPDGVSIVFARAVDGDIEVHVMRGDGSDVRRLTHRPGADYGARFSPDGTRIAYHATFGDEARIMVMDADGSSPRVVTRGAQHYDPAWSPDGRWILFTGAPLGASRFDLLVVPADGGADPVAYVAGDVDERGGSWRPEP